MGMSAPDTDFTRRFERLEQDLRAARLVPKVHAEARTYNLGQPAAGDKMVIAVGALDGSYGLEPLEAKQLIGYKAVALGTSGDAITVDLDYHDTPGSTDTNIASSYSVPIGTVASIAQVTLSPFVDLADGDQLTLTVDSVTGSPTLLAFTPVLLVRR